MDTEQSQPEMNEKKGRSIKIAIITALLLLPLIFLFIKFTSNSGPVTENSASTTPAPLDIAAYENAAKANPTFDNLINLSNAYINSNVAGKSIAPLLKAIELNPKSAIAYNNLCVAYTMIQEYNHGIDACNKALEIDSSFQLAKNNLKWATSEKNNLISYIEKQTQTPEKDRNVQFYVNYGLNYMKIGEYDKSIEAWNKIFETDPKSIVALNNIGTVLMMKSQVDEAASMFKKAVEINPEDQLSKNNLAWAMMEVEKKKKQ